MIDFPSRNCQLRKRPHLVSCRMQAHRAMVRSRKQVIRQQTVANAPCSAVWKTASGEALLKFLQTKIAKIHFTTVILDRDKPAKRLVGDLRNFSLVNVLNDNAVDHDLDLRTAALNF